MPLPGFYLMVFNFCLVTGSHFRGAVFTWIPNPNGTSITIDYRISWRGSYSSSLYCNDTMISSRSLVPGEGSLTCFSNCTGKIGSLAFICTDFSDTVNDDWSTGRNKIVYAPNPLPKHFTFGFTSCCWITTLKTGGGSLDWSLMSSVDLTVRGDTGKINTPPTVDLPPIVHLQYGCRYTIQLPISDVDGDYVRCRWANGTTECGDVCGAFPTQAILNSTLCTLTYQPQQNYGYYAAALQIEDFASETSQAPLSSIPLQFLVNVYRGTGCNDAPVFVSPTPADKACFALDVGETINITIKARNSQPLRRVGTLSAVGMVRSNEVKYKLSSDHYIDLNVTWTPKEADAGKDHNLCFYAADSRGVISNFRCLNIPVSVVGPTPLRVERVGITNTWIIVIDQTFSRPTESAFLRVFETGTNKELFAVDASSSQDVVFDAPNKRVTVSFRYSFDIDKDYHVTIPSGFVEGHVGCGALSVPINDSSFWAVEIDCGNVQIDHGSVNAPNGTIYPNSVTYSCNIGFDLVGNNTRTCTANGTWTGTEPYCQIRDCGSFNVSQYLTISTNSTTFNTTVIFTCIRGFELIGNSTTYCDHTPAWNSYPPTCKLIDCGNLTAPQNGVVSVPSGTTFSKMATYTCNLGYNLVGSKTRQCQQDKSWNGSKPSCVLADCGQLTAPSNGIIDIGLTTFRHTANYSCRYGYILFGNSRRECLANGTWSHSDPKCDITECGFLAAPVHGSLMASEFTFGALITFSCEDGYDLKGPVVLQCSANNSWNGTVPRCIARDCGSLDSPFHGNISLNGRTYRSNAIYTCDVGYDLDGTNNRTCFSDGAWSGTEPVCKIKDCGHLAIDDGIVDTANGTTYSSSVTYICNVGFYLVGNNKRTCTDNGTWSGNDPVCVIRDCGSVADPENGRAQLSGTIYGSEANFTCNIGYDLVGAMMTICLSDGNWSSDSPVCIIKNCGELLVTNGVVDAPNGTIYTNTVTYRCNTGFDLVGNNTRTCTANGTWTSNEPFCQIKDCGHLSIDDGIVDTANGTTYSSSATYSCNVGFYLVGNKKRTCTDNGTWSGTEPVCVIRDCGSVADPENGRAQMSGTVYGSEATFTCNTGYDLVGAMMTMCLSDGNWSSDSPVCKIKDCGELLVDNGVVDAPNGTIYPNAVTYRCNSGFYLVGNNTRTCTANGAWTNNEPYCKIQDCGHLSIDDGIVDTANGTTYSSSVTYSCNVGFYLVGNNKRTCTDNGTWSGTEPVCVIRDCGSVADPENGRAQQSGTVYGSEVSFTCNTGFDLVGARMTICLSDGNWSSDSPVCNIKDCGSVGDPENGRAVLSGTVYRSEATFTCNTGYDLVGAITAICLSDGSWSSYSTFCKIKDCGPVVDPENGRALLAGTVYGSEATFTCNTGFDLVGARTTICLSDGNWRSDSPFCKIKDCGELLFANGVVDAPNGTIYPNAATYRCNTGFDLVGNNSRTCTANGTWTSNEPYCQIRDCGRLSIDDGIVDTVNGTTYSSSATYSCNVGFYLVGNNKRTCTDNGTWSDTEPVCVIRDCGSVADPENGRAQLSGTVYGSQATFTCNTGFDLVGARMTICLSDGNWSSDSPFCKIKDCGSVGDPENGRAVLSGTVYRSEATFTCNTGYDLVGAIKAICLSDGSWSSYSTFCKIKDCGPVAGPENGRALLAGTVYGSEATFTCNTGFDLVGARTTICLLDGNWSSDSPFCKIKDCGELLVDNGVVDAPNGTIFPNTVTYRCNTGFDLVGNNTRTCTANGTWTSNEPHCKIQEKPETGLVVGVASGAVITATILSVVGVKLMCRRRGYIVN